MFEDITNARINRAEPIVIPKYLLGKNLLFAIILKNSNRASTFIARNNALKVYLPRSIDPINKVR